MKLILIPDNPACPFSNAQRPKVAISIPGDDHTIYDILDKLVTPALVAMSFHPQTIQDGYREAQVMGARADEADPDDLTGWAKSEPELPAHPGTPTIPGGFTVVGYGVDLGEELEFNIGDLVFSASGSIWNPTYLVNGYNVWYAARNGSETLAKIQSILAAR